MLKIIIPTLQMRKMRLQMVTLIDHRTYRRQCWNQI